MAALSSISLSASSYQWELVLRPSNDIAVLLRSFPMWSVTMQETLLPIAPQEISVRWVADLFWRKEATPSTSFTSMKSAANSLPVYRLGEQRQASFS
ncbi:hypothetical protein PAXRUDRAFT_827000 [Paxillus rubicundulus Ve08.2h10]|uniref:Uncharacterized protein n=1 Tax=Paxillus rubicundulus Ve08.2h10 TaxID=930991 RepID=A0A0D0DDS7_9AGAM|nr:hypothetical protein PAXRUDRAFT_827000 [Paxillus rubicundulus Ve08.2h10]